MKRAAFLLLLLSACKTVPLGSSNTGADNARAAVERFLAAARAQDLQAMSVVWGNEKGAQRDQLARPELEQREVIMIRLLRHDQARIAEPQRGANGRLAMTVDLKQGTLTASPVFTTVRASSGRWYVENVDLTLLQNKGFGGKS